MRVDSSEVSSEPEGGIETFPDCNGVRGCGRDEGPGSGWSSRKRARGWGFAGGCRRIMIAGFEEVEDALVRVTPRKKER